MAQRKTGIKYLVLSIMDKQKYEAVIGLEVHVELNTKSKMFCRCSANYFGAEPNTHTCPVCLGLPGALPYPNKEAIKDCIKIGLALNCQIADESLFERKNYFYPDLPKGYQISQYRWPLCVNGELEVEGVGGKTKIRINRVHQEEDTGKLTHLNGSTAIDFNRSSVPLVEIVSEPDFHDSTSVMEYTKKLQQLFRYLGVSNADMEKGDMRLEANVSVRPVGSEELPNYRIELKNINSFRFMKAAIEYEIKRQIEALEKGEKLTQETRGWNETKKETFLQRSKEEAHDYRYFPDPDLPVLSIKYLVSSIKEEISELPWDKEQRFIKDYEVVPQTARILGESQDFADYFEKVIEVGKAKGVEAKEIANFMVNKKPDITKMSPEEIVIQLAQRNVGMIEDEDEIEKLAKEAMEENPAAVADYKKGKVNALQSLLGVVMRKSQGKAPADKVKLVLERLLK